MLVSGLDLHAPDLPLCWLDMVHLRPRRPPVYPSQGIYKHLPSPPPSATDTCGFSETSTSRRSSASCSRYTMTTPPPTLSEILRDVSPPPYTLTAFMAYLSQNHCMETLEFTLDSQRYSAFYDQLVSQNSNVDACNRVCALWEKLMQVYIVPCSPREVNIPSSVRDRLLALPTRPTPPHPSELDDAGRIIYELMNDSLLVPFLESVTPLHVDIPSEDYLQHLPMQPVGSRSAVARLRSTSSSQAQDSEGLTDDSDANSPSATEPMTPPTTPPTSEWGFHTSPGGFQRAMAAHNKGWKKVGAKLGFNRKPTVRRATPTSSTADSDGSTSEQYQNNSL
ncbi:RGS domain-containing protein [Stachybotrys elegans]|uniref:RGS domain-containing protein n=1 Tax=Stachybotrys elegans TaxID=80388 RepID=A0A8K0SJE9_9HYPO|nr:RGS domain-containing protein [Stachybotrys elegans]